MMCPPALRPAVVVLLAMMAAEGTSVLRNVYVINRGYEDLAERLNSVGRADRDLPRHLIDGCRRTLPDLHEAGQEGVRRHLWDFSGTLRLYRPFAGRPSYAKTASTAVLPRTGAGQEVRVLAQGESRVRLPEGVHAVFRGRLEVHRAAFAEWDHPCGGQGSLPAARIPGLLPELRQPRKRCSFRARPDGRTSSWKILLRTCLVST